MERTFTVICNLCGEKQTFKQGDSAKHSNIEMKVGKNRSNRGVELYPAELSIYCGNHECDNSIDLDC